jgi:hypothetical protein
MMPKIKLVAMPAPDEKPVDAKTIGEHFGFTDKYINRLAAAGLIPFLGKHLGGKRVYRRFYISAVEAALAHDVKPPRSVESERENSRQKVR